ncbi:MAG: hypothetical protein M3O03_12370 [Pseudomonadota bacterium]|nr:hypothetical protein [Pseudomonadota bacterium]
MSSKFFCALFVGLSLSACTSVPLASIPKLARIDFMTTDLSRLRVAIALSDALSPKPQGVVMEMKTKIGDEPEQAESLHLVESKLAQDQQGLPTDQPKNQTLHVFKLSATDVLRLNALRQRVADAKKQHQKGSLNLGIAAKEFCKLSDLPPGPALTTTYVLTSETESYVTMVQDFNLRSDAKTAEGLDKLEPCT